MISRPAVIQSQHVSSLRPHGQVLLSFLLGAGCLLLMKMGKFMKFRKVMVLAGDYFRCKAGILKNINDGTSDLPHSHGLVATKK